MASLLHRLDVKTVDATGELAKQPAAIQDGWQLKVYALMASAFDQVLLLDADIVPTQDPACVFEWSKFKQTGAVLWPDLVDLVAESEIWPACGLAPRTVSSIESGQILIDKTKCWSALQATGHAHNTVLIGEIAPRGQTGPGLPGNFSGMVPLQFIRALYCVDGSLHPLSGNAAALRGCPTTAAASKAFPTDNPGLFDATGFAFHPYPQGQVPPNVPTAPDGLGANYADLPQLPALERTLDGALTAYGSSYRFPLYDTEFGYQTNPPEKALRAISPGKAAYYENWAEYLSWRDPRVVSWDQYLLADPPPPSMFDTGIEFSGGAHKVPLYAAFRMPIYMPVVAAKAGKELGVWGCVRPAHFAMLGPHEPQYVSIQFQSAPGQSWKTVKRVLLTDAYGYFETGASFPSSGNVRLSWSYPHHGSQIHSRTVQITIR